MGFISVPGFSWDLSLVLCYYVVLIITPICRLLAVEKFLKNLKIQCHPICNRLQHFREPPNRYYGVATISGRLKIIGLFCRICSLLQGPFAKETYNLKEPTNRSHPILHISASRSVRCACVTHPFMSHSLPGSIYVNTHAETHTHIPPTGDSQRQCLRWPCATNVHVHKCEYAYTF